MRITRRLIPPHNQRFVVVEKERKKLVDRQPVTILDNQKNVEESKRALKEKQKNLFGESEQGLPPIHLLDDTIRKNKPSEC